MKTHIQTLQEDVTDLDYALRNGPNDKDDAAQYLIRVKEQAALLASRVARTTLRNVENEWTFEDVDADVNKPHSE